MSQAEAIVIAAVISAVAGIIIARFQDIADLLRPTRSIRGTWDGDVYLSGSVLISPQTVKEGEAGEPDTKYIITLGQTGRRIIGTMDIEFTNFDFFGITIPILLTMKHTGIE